MKNSEQDIIYFFDVIEELFNNGDQYAVDLISIEIIHNLFQGTSNKFQTTIEKFLPFRCKEEMNSFKNWTPLMLRVRKDN